MQHHRSRRGNSFQERDSDGRFTSSDFRSGGYDSRYNGGGYGGRYTDYSNERRGYGGHSQPENQGEYGYEDAYRDYPQGLYRGYNQDYGYRNENDDRFENRYNDYEERERGYNDRGYDDYDRRYDQRQRAYRQGDYDQRGYQSGYDDYRHRGQGPNGGRLDWQYNRSNHAQDRRNWHDGNGRASAESYHRGFETMPRSEVRRIAAMGGRASHGGSSHSRRGRVSNRRRPRTSR
jgi:hypothetical protein